jgi:hypothetical protein
MPAPLTARSRRAAFTPSKTHLKAGAGTLELLAWICLAGVMATYRPRSFRRCPASPVRARRQPLEANQREMSERQHRVAFEHAHAAMALGPSRDSVSQELVLTSSCGGWRRTVQLSRV